MTPQLISIYALVAMFVVATIWPINMGILAFVGAFLVGTLVAGQETSAIIDGFPGGLFLTLVGITYLFALAQNNGTIDWLVRLAVRAVRGQIAAIPWIMFGISAVLTSVGAVSPGAVAIIAPIALGFAFRYQISPLLMGLMVVHGAQAGGFSPISIYGGITNGVVAEAGLPLSPMTTFGASFFVNGAVALILFLLLGGRSLMSARFVPEAVNVPHIEITKPATGPQIFGDSEAESLSPQIGREAGGEPNRLTADNPRVEPADGNLYQIATLAGLAALAVLVLAFKLDIGFVSLTIGLVLSLMAPTLQRRAMAQVAWPEIMLITGVSTYVAVLEAMGTITFVGDSVAGLASPLLAALLLCFIGAVVSAFASSTAVLGSLIPLAVPFLQAGTGVSAIGFIAAMAVASTIVDVSPFSTNGALVLANAQGIDRQVFFRRLLGYGALVTVLAPIIVWLIFVVVPDESVPETAPARTDRIKEIVVRKPSQAPRETRPAFLGELLETLNQRGRALLRRKEQPAPVPAPQLAELGDLLLSRRGEASGVALARALLAAFDAAEPTERLAFLRTLADRFGPDRAAVDAAIETARREDASIEAIEALHAAAEPRRQELVRRLNLAPGGTAALVHMREELLKHVRQHPELRRVDADFGHLFASWFNRGFLVLRHIDWTTPANILEKIIRYEAVHAIQNWDDLRNRLEPTDRRCYGFFHPQLVDEPLIFVEVALTEAIPDRVGPLLDLDRTPIDPGQASTAVFYSISNTQRGLAGVSFGNFLIKQVVEDLKAELPDIRTFVTLSPVPGFASWLARERESEASELLDPGLREALRLLDEPGWHLDAAKVETVRIVLIPIAAHYFLKARTPDGRPLDPVARFHLGNGARLERLNFLGDVSANGLKQSHGLMVNYLYALDEIERNHEALAEKGVIAASNSVRGALPIPA